MQRSLISGALVALIALAPAGCVVLDATSVGISVMTGNRVVGVSGQAAQASPGSVVEAISLKTGKLVGRGTVDDARTFSLRISLPVSEPLSVVLRSPNQAALLMTDPSGKRQEERAVSLTAGSTTVAWALGALLAGIPIPSSGPWKADEAAWTRLNALLPVSLGLALEAAAGVLDTSGVAYPPAAASELANALAATRDRLRAVAGGEPRDAVLWPSVLLGWSDAVLTTNKSAPGDQLATLVASEVDLRLAADRAWLSSPHAEGHGAVEVAIPLKGAESQQPPIVLPSGVRKLRYTVNSALLEAPRQGEFDRASIHFEAGTVILRVPDMPPGFVDVSVSLLGEYDAPLGTVATNGHVTEALVRKLTTDAITLSVADAPPLTPGAKENP